jgi:hypothetical protein
MAPALAWAVCIVLSSGYLLRCLTIYDDETWAAYVKEKKRANELEMLLISTVRWGCDSMEDIHDRREAGQSLDEIASPNIEQRRELESELWAVRTREGTETEFDLKTRQLLIKRQKQRVEYEKMLERDKEEALERKAFFDRIRRLIRQTFGPFE